MLVGKETDLTILESPKEEDDRGNMPRIPGLNLNKIKTPTIQHRNVADPNVISIMDNDHLDAALTAKIKKVFNYGKLDLTDDNNF
jgi:hypothetical protein